MKLASQLARLKVERARAAAPKPAPHKKNNAVRRNWVALGLCLLFAVGGTWAVLEIFIWHKLPPALVGAWEVQGGPMQGGSFEFLSNGTLTIRSNQGPDMKAHVAVDGKTLLTTTQNPITSRDETRRSAIQELTATSLVLQLERGDVLKMTRKK